MFGECCRHSDDVKRLNVDQTGPDLDKWARSPRRVVRAGCVCVWEGKNTAGIRSREKAVTDSNRPGPSAYGTSWQLTKPSGDLGSERDVWALRFVMRCASRVSRMGGSGMRPCRNSGGSWAGLVKLGSSSSCFVSTSSGQESSKNFYVVSCQLEV